MKNKLYKKDYVNGKINKKRSGAFSKGWAVPHGGIQQNHRAAVWQKHTVLRDFLLFTVFYKNLFLWVKESWQWPCNDRDLPAFKDRRRLQHIFCHKSSGWSDRIALPWSRHISCARKILSLRDFLWATCRVLLKNQIKDTAKDPPDTFDKEFDCFP